MFRRVNTGNPNQNPDLKQLAFRPDAIAGDLFDGGGAAPDRLREGHVEVISLGHSTVGEVASAAKHGADGTPADYRNVGDFIGCPLVSEAFNSQSLARLNSTALQFGEPINALQGNGYLISITDGRAAGFDPVVLANFYNPGPVAFNPGLAPVMLGVGVDGTTPWPPMPAG